MLFVLQFPGAVRNGIPFNALISSLMIKLQHLQLPCERQGIVLPDFFPRARNLTTDNIEPRFGPVFLTKRNKGFLLSLKELVLRMSSSCDFKELTNFSSVPCDETTRIALFILRKTHEYSFFTFYLGLNLKQS